eukprot:sb/3460277/
MRTFTVFVDKLCPHDPAQYQACGDWGRVGAKLNIFPTDPVCGAICYDVRKGMYQLNPSSQVCSTAADALQTKITVPLGSGARVLELWMKEGGICDGICDYISLGREDWSTEFLTCVDERDCNGHQYGSVLWNVGAARYQFAPFNGLDTASDHVKTRKGCMSYFFTVEEGLFPLTSKTRCFKPLPSFTHMVKESEGFRFQSYCTDFMDQTNCTDPAMVAGSCLIGGFSSTVSVHAVCHEIYFDVPNICDDAIETLCRPVSRRCLTHKHRLCNGVDDCAMGVDEKGGLCSKLTLSTCTRGFSLKEGVLRIPAEWVQDGDVDCLDGSDERDDWETCGKGPRKRIKYMPNKCADVFLCKDDKGQFVEGSLLCSFSQKCDEGVCHASRKRVAISQNLLSSRTHKGHVYKNIMCTKGLENLLVQSHKECISTEFSHPFHSFSGKTLTTELVRPRIKRDCRYLYGEAYVYYSCSRLCHNAGCPLVTPVLQSTCSNIKDITYSLNLQLNTLTVVQKSGDSYHNNFFVCKNTDCILFERVCDLVDDCGDGSDEEGCASNFQCSDKSAFLALNQRCDGKFDCIDFSDECNVNVAMRTFTVFVDKLCPHDPAQYQACGDWGRVGAKLNIFPTDPVCGAICYDVRKGMYQLNPSSQVCSTAADALQTKITVPLGSGARVLELWVKEGGICDGVCDYISVGREDWSTEFLTCVDERDCNGHQYGSVLWNVGAARYQFAPFNGLDTASDHVKTRKGCMSYFFTVEEGLFPLTSKTRCFKPLPSFTHMVKESEGFRFQSYCTDFMDQTNCTDPAMVAGSCLIGGFSSTVSVHAVCHEIYFDVPNICDDAIETLCRPVSRRCLTHKHRLCNGVDDCAMGVDEKGGLCSKLTLSTCTRGFSLKEGVLRIPAEWVQDGTVDCLDGSDERDDWETCGKGPRKRIKYMPNKCADVFLCKDDKGQFVEGSLLCSFSQKCDEGVCHASRKRVSISQNLLSSRTHKGQVYKNIMCTKGLENLLVQSHKECISTEFSHPFHSFSGKTLTTELVRPRIKRDCRYLYGEAYVYYSCSRLCHNAGCPLVTPVLQSTCSNIKDITYSLNLQLNTLTVVQKSGDSYHNNFFVCKNTDCILFERVCDLVDDCGDGSDEEGCASNFQCSDKSAFLALNQRCDGKFDCIDFSDECNDSCRRKAVYNDGVLALAVIMGVFGLIFGVIVVSKGVCEVRESKKSGEFINKSMVLAISFADLLTSVYLLTFAFFHWYIDSNFCENQVEWISGGPCMVIGVLNTVGATMSSVVMALVSCYRLAGNLRALRYRGSDEVTGQLRWRVILQLVAVVVASVAVAMIPLVDAFDKWFVNGLVFEKHIALFIGVMSKSRLLDVFRGYPLIHPHGSCLIGGFSSTVSVHAVCHEIYFDVPNICDDAIETLCRPVSRRCLTHKHRLCNGVDDCAMGVDEKGGLCSKLTLSTCTRGFSLKEGVLRIPAEWVQDGDVDCLDGSDERDDWETCGKGPRKRIKYMPNKCADVFLCKDDKGQFVEGSLLCSFSQKCDEGVCHASRKRVAISQNLLSSRTHKGHVYKNIMCTKGLENLLVQSHKECISTEFSHPFHSFSGKTLTTELVLPRIKRDCRYLYGEAYVYYTCSRLCHNAGCPLVTPVLQSTCSNIKDITYSLNLQLNTLTVVQKSGDSYHNNFFVCKNTDCILFERVCDLVDDCGDGSDEEGCASNFQCSDKSAFLALNQRCDGKFDCIDFSDECNDSCRRKAVYNDGVLALAVIMGVFGLIFGVIVVSKGVCEVRESKKSGEFINKSMVLAISFADLLTSVYLLTFAFFHWYIDSNFCENQVEWISGVPCMVIGVLNTVGSTMSSVVMALVSCYRLAGNLRALRYRGSDEVTGQLRGRVILQLVAVVVASVAVAMIPLVDAFDKWFVNGLVFEKHIALFIGVMSKSRLLDVFRGYHSTRKAKQSMHGIEVSWSGIQNMVSEMFSSDYDRVIGKKLSFYGNDPVCMFKAFVLADDPQVFYVWAYLSFHFLSFVCVAVCHVTIAVGTYKNSVRATRKSSLGRKVTLICLTDFCCWMPFLICCALHTAEVVDMSPWYQVFSLNILPLNSFINPMLYSPSQLFTTAFHKIMALFCRKHQGKSVAEIPRGAVEERRDTGTDFIRRQTLTKPWGTILFSFTHVNVGLVLPTNQPTNDQQMFQNLIKEAMAEAINFEGDDNTKRALAQMVTRNESEIAAISDVIRTRFDSSSCRPFSWYSRYIFSSGSLLSMNNFQTNTELGTFHSANNFGLCIDSSFMEVYKDKSERSVLMFSCHGERATVLDSQYIRITKNGRILTHDGWCWTADPQQDSIGVRKCTSGKPTQEWVLQERHLPYNEHLHLSTHCQYFTWGAPNGCASFTYISGVNLATGDYTVILDSHMYTVVPDRGFGTLSFRGYEGDSDQDEVLPYSSAGLAGGALLAETTFLKRIFPQSILVMKMNPVSTPQLLSSMALRAWLCGGGVKMSCCSQVLHFNGNDPWLDRYLQNDQQMFQNLLKEAMAEAINFEGDDNTKRALAQMVARNESEIAAISDVIRTRFDSSSCRPFSWYSRYIFSSGSLLSMNNFQTNTELGTFHSAKNYGLCIDSSFMEVYKDKSERSVLLFSCHGERATVLDSQYIRITKNGRILTHDGWCWTADPQQDSIGYRQFDSGGCIAWCIAPFPIIVEQPNRITCLTMMMMCLCWGGALTWAFIISGLILNFGRLLSKPLTLPTVVSEAHELLHTLRLRPRCIYSQSTTLSRGAIFHKPIHLHFALSSLITLTLCPFHIDHRCGYPGRQSSLQIDRCGFSPKYGARASRISVVPFHVPNGSLWKTQPGQVLFTLCKMIYLALGIILTAAAATPVKDGDQCPIIAENGFLVRSCSTRMPDGSMKMTCTTSPNTTYYKHLIVNVAMRTFTVFVDKLCPHDPAQYQACGDWGRVGAKLNIFPTDPVCGAICYDVRKGMYQLNPSSQVCSTAADALQTKITVPLGSGARVLELWMKEGGICDGICDYISLGREDWSTEFLTCVDERDCNGHQYGSVLWNVGAARYQFAPFNGLDTASDHVKTRKGCMSYFFTVEEGLFPLTSKTRCFKPLPSFTHMVKESEGFRFQSYCTDFMDQTNCTDPAMVAGSCLIGGFSSTVSVHAVCHEIYFDVPNICDDAIETLCRPVSRRCLTHKHRLCNGVDDCAMGVDEKGGLCSKLTLSTCTRGFSLKEGVLRIPAEWVQDGDVDCLDGSDERDDWETCGKGPRKRIKYMPNKCADVFLCKDDKGQFVEGSLLCSFSQKCDEGVCHASRKRVAISQNLLSSRTHKGHVYKNIMCTKGLENLLVQSHKECISTEFSHPFHSFSGKTLTTELVRPRIKRDCRYLYGEAYVYYSCSRLCHNAGCPLVTPVLQSTCSNIKDITYSLNLQLNTLTVVQKSGDSYHNNFFVCKNTDCILFERVCDLVDDCGDGSDEEGCASNFQCSDKSAFLALNQRCDGKFDCIDFSDECNVNVAMRTFTVFVDKLCPHDPAQYQACGDWGRVGAKLNIFPTDPVCGAICYDVRKGMYQLNPSSQVCSTAADALQTKITVPLGSGARVLELWVKEGGICDGVCDYISVGREDWSTEFLTCVDERDCNGHQYGSVLWNVGAARYQFAPFNGLDTASDHVKTRKGCMSYFFTVEEGLFPLTSKTRCFKPLPSFTHMVKESEGFRFQSYCTDFMDQTNCTDPAMVAGSCLIGGFSSTVSVHAVCHEIYFDVPNICDDAIETLCRPVSRRCLTHKHRLCNGVDDCAMGVDEKGGLCSKLTLSTCTRGFSLKEGVLRIPAEWVQDGTVDCLDGSDERDDWETCGKGPRKRIKYMPNKCADVFLCKDDKGQFVEGSLLCSFSQKCDEGVCHASRKRVSISQNLLSSRTHKGQVYKNIMCTKGLENLLVQSHKECISTEFSHPFHSFSGKTLTTELVRPRIKRDCRYLYGEAYVYYSCSRLCHNAGCPLVTPVLQSTCSNIKDITYSLNLQLNTLTVVQKSGDSYHNNFFVCKNTDCILFERVCDLVDDCGDGSDEEGCASNFQCSDKSAFLALNQRCDGKFDCIDFSDECNDSCRRKAVYNDGVLALAVIMGVFGLIFGVIVVSKGVCEVRESKKSGEFINKSMVLAISFADLLTSVYLLTFAFFHWYIDSNFCENQVEWISGGPCMVIGVLNTVGATMSSVVMALVSCYRLAGNLRALRYRGSDEVTGQLRWRVILQLVAVVVASVAVAMIPLVDAFDKWFVNGLVFEKHIALFIGVMSKSRLLDVFRGYPLIHPHGSCLIGGFSSTVSVHAVCHEIYFDVPNICDDAIETLCRPVSRRCLTHKHRLCNGVDDCAMGVDEKGGLCSKLTLSTCTRGFSLKEGVLRIPAEWVQDGDVDCLDGSDERDDWETCGKGPRKRIKYMPNKCADVFLCKDDKGQFVEGSLLCSFSQKCDEGVCHASRKRVAISQNLLSSRTHKGHVYKNIMCTKGLENLLVQSHKECISTEFSHPFHSFSGKTLTTELVLPRIKRDCRYLYGEAYVYYTCSRLCHNAGCPLVTPVLQSTCSNIKDITYSLNLQLNTLTVVQKSGDSYHNNFFVCKNTDCILFERVCDLVDDCGDGSDEEGCASNFQCSDKSAFLALNQRCDGKFDCIDFSDECNDSCRRKAVYNDGVLALAVIMGVFGLIFGVIVVSKGVCEVRESKKSGEFINKSMVLAISFADLLTSVYLLTFAFFHWYIDSNFCENQVEWISGVPCMVIGVLNTVGSTMSSVVMALVSCYRLAGNLRALRYRGSDEVTGQLRGRVILQLVAVVVASVAVAMIPLVDAFDKWFVNGLVFEKHIALFIGVMSKSRLLDVFRGYHSTRKAKQSMHGIEVSWSGIQNMVSEMFSSDYDRVIGKKLSFYGNDPVCMFKAFVLADDPQVFYVWAYLSFHFLSFVCVAVCHVTIAVGTYKNSVRATRKSSLGRKVTLICLTDFCCWMPFLICCALHTAEVVDMSPWYQVFSLNILPLNSFINPMLYSPSQLFTTAFHKIMALFCRKHQGKSVAEIPRGAVEERRDTGTELEIGNTAL